MKNLKKVLAFVFAMVMVLAMGTSVFAAATTQHEIHLYSTAPQKEKHSYSAYQVFVGTYDTASKQLQNFAWGNGVDSDALLTELKTLDTAYTDCETAAQVAAVLDGKADDSAEAKAFAEAVSKHLTTGVASTVNEDGYIINVTGDGYYFIKDESASLSQGDTYSSYMLQVIGDVEVKAKDSTTESQKKLKDSDDTAGTLTDWQDSADWDIGDHVPFQLTGKVADDYDKYEKYYFAFHDTEGTGLTFDNNAKVYVDGTEITTGFTVVTSDLDDGCTFDVVFENLKQVTSAKVGSVITVEYTSTLNENAVIGQKGNPNTSHIEFSNNPNGEQKGTGKTPDDTVIVFTYKSTVTKLDEKEAALKGADFTLYKEVQSTYTGAKTGAAIKENFANGVIADALQAAKYYVEVTNKEGDTSGNVFSFKGIDDGTYVLVETTVPAGYNAWDAEQFVVTATHTTEANIDPDSGKVAGGTDYILTALTGESLFGDAGDGTITLAADKADLDVSIVNQSGSVLPETGGMGTTIFYILGTILVLGAGVLLITRRRMNSK